MKGTISLIKMSWIFHKLTLLKNGIPLVVRFISNLFFTYVFLDTTFIRKQ